MDDLLQEHAKIVQFISLAEEVTGRKKLAKNDLHRKKDGISFRGKI